MPSNPPMQPLPPLFMIADAWPNDGEWSDEEIEVFPKPVYWYKFDHHIYPVECASVGERRPYGAYPVSRWRTKPCLTAQELVRYRIFLGGSHQIDIGPCYALQGASVELRGESRVLFATDGAKIVCRDRSMATLSGNAAVELRDRSAAHLMGSSKAFAYDHTLLILSDHATAECWDQSEVSMMHESKVICHHKTVKVACTDTCVVEGEYTPKPIWGCRGSLTA